MQSRFASNGRTATRAGTPQRTVGQRCRAPGTPVRAATDIAVAVSNMSMTMFLVTVASYVMQPLGRGDDVVGLIAG